MLTAAIHNENEIVDISSIKKIFYILVIKSYKFAYDWQISNENKCNDTE